ncbi:transposase [Desulfofarcimen acetoxidans]|uniref:transposase n=1 Tax=Desulfofarcimen acetoxidans TaxID=58138 RepID=UPI001F60AF03|nr:transposase [Desulfofarcimen acetoxidans]
MFLPVPPHGTSQTCLCGANVPKDLSVRVHLCPACGMVMPRDLVSSHIDRTSWLRNASGLDI